MEQQIPVVPYDELFTSEDEECHLGRGSFSEVYRCYHETHRDVAVKILNANVKNPIRCFNKEGLLHLKANACEYIITLIGLTQKDKFVGIVMEYMPYGALSDHIRNEQIEIPWTFRLRTMAEVACAVDYLHHLTQQKRLIHCDLKVENIMLNVDLHAKVGDFGGAGLSNYTGTSFQSTTQAQSCTRDKDLIQYTLSYAAPELLDVLDANRTPYMDVYSFAIILYVVTSRLNPFSNITSPEVVTHAVKEGQRPRRNLDIILEDLQESRDDTGIQVYNLFCHLMEQCWKREPKERLSSRNVRDSLWNKIRSFPEQKVSEDVLKLKQRLGRGGSGKPVNSIAIHEKYLNLHAMGALHDHGRPSTSSLSQQRTVVRTPIGSAQIPQQPVASSRQMLQPQPARRHYSEEPQSAPPQQQVPHRSISDDVLPRLQSLSMTPKVPVSMPAQRPPTTATMEELEANFTDPFLRIGNQVRMITDIAAVKNAQVGHGGWVDTLNELRDVQGTVSRVENNGDVTVSFSSVRSHRFNPNALVKIPSENDLHVGDFVIITLEKQLVEVMQEGHGGWVEDMHQYFSQAGMIFRFLPDRDVLVVHKNGMYFRFNPEVLCKKPHERVAEICLPENPNIKIGDYVCQNMDDELLKELQENFGGWNDQMASLRGKAGKLVYADYHARAFVAYNSKLCFVFNPVCLTKVSNEEALRKFIQTKDDAKKQAQVVIDEQMHHHRFTIGDLVRVHLPLDIVVELQRGHGGWCYQMLEVYGLQGVVKGFDEGNNAQVLFDSGSKWTLNPAALERLLPGQTPPPAYTPPFRIGDKVQVRLKELNNASLNKMRHAFKMLDIPEEKVDILLKTGTVLGIDDDIDVIVSFGDGKNYGLKPEQLQKK